MTAAKRRGSSRRKFLRDAGAAGVATLAAGVFGSPRVSGATTVGPNDEIRVGVIGVGVRGKYLIGNLPEAARVVALCDCSSLRIGTTLEPTGTFAPVLARFREVDAPRCATHRDYRTMLEREKLDVVVIATPDHHHALPAILALRAGLDVYLEKPVSLTIREGRAIADAVKRTGRVLQVGSQQRTMEVNRFACDFLRRGGLGRITRVELPNYPGPSPVPAFDEEPSFGGVDFDLFCGPAPTRPHHRRLWMKEDFQVDDLLWRGWDLFRDYSGHLMTNWGAHSVDMVQLALGRDDSGPVAIELAEPRDAEELWAPWKAKSIRPTGDESDRRFWPVTMRYDDGVELRFTHGTDWAIFHGERGRLWMRRNEFKTDPPGLVVGAPDDAAAAKWRGGGSVARPHLENWLDAVASRGAVNAPIEVGHRTATVCHLANVARELNRPLRWDPARERFVDDEEADRRLDRPRRPGFELPSL